MAIALHDIDRRTLFDKNKYLKLYYGTDFLFDELVKSLVFNLGT